LPATWILFVIFESGRTPQEDEGLPHRLPARLAVGVGADPGEEGAIGLGRVPEAKGGLLAKDPPHGVVDACLGDAARLDEALQGRSELGVAVRDHDHVDAGVDCGLDVRRVVAGELVDARPVGDHEAREAELALQDVGQEVAVAVHLLAVPAAEGGHDGADAGRDGGAVAGQVDGPEGGLVHLRVALVAAARRPAVGDVVLGAGQDRGLVAPDGGRGHLGNELGCLAEALVRPAPALVAGDGDAGREGPANSRRSDLLGRGPGHAFDEARVTRAAEADVVREEDRPDHVVVAVDGVDAVHERDAQAGLEGVRLITVVHLRPAGGRAVGRGGAAAAQHRAEEEVSDVGLPLEARAVGLGHLADLLVERHVAEEGLHVPGGRGGRVGRGGSAAPTGQGGRKEEREGEATTHGQSVTERTGLWVGL
jgi:hypothetical protein